MGWPSAMEYMEQLAPPRQVVARTARPEGSSRALHVAVPYEGWVPMASSASAWWAQSEVVRALARRPPAGSKRSSKRTSQRPLRVQSAPDVPQA